jgi:hypothetical protein
MGVGARETESSQRNQRAVAESCCVEARKAMTKGSRMSQEPLFNEDRFYRYPMGRIAAIINDDRGLNEALKHLPQAGVDLADVNVLSGPEGIRLLDRRGVRRGLRSRLLRLLQLTVYEGVALETHEQALRNGHYIIYVPVRGEEQVRNAVDILRHAGGHYLLQFHRWTVEELRF